MSNRTVGEVLGDTNIITNNATGNLPQWMTNTHPRVTDKRSHTKQSNSKINNYFHGSYTKRSQICRSLQGRITHGNRIELP